MTTLMLCLENMFSRIEMIQSKPCDDPDKSNLSVSFITAVKNSAKSGGWQANLLILSIIKNNLPLV